jgi:hypothetical protein
MFSQNTPNANQKMMLLHYKHGDNAVCVVTSHTCWTHSEVESEKRDQGGEQWARTAALAGPLYGAL